eukprot:3939975-Amphidinium_carterae.1
MRDQVCQHGVQHHARLSSSLVCNSERMLANYQRMPTLGEMADENAVIATADLLQVPVLVMDFRQHAVWVYAPTNCSFSCTLAFWCQNLHFWRVSEPVDLSSGHLPG